MYRGVVHHYSLKSEIWFATLTVGGCHRPPSCSKRKSYHWKWKAIYVTTNEETNSNFLRKSRHGEANRTDKYERKTNLVSSHSFPPCRSHPPGDRDLYISTKVRTGGICSKFTKNAPQTDTEIISLLRDDSWRDVMRRDQAQDVHGNKQQTGDRRLGNHLSGWFKKRLLMYLGFGSGMKNFAAVLSGIPISQIVGPCLGGSYTRSPSCMISPGRKGVTSFLENSPVS